MKDDSQNNDPQSPRKLPPEPVGPMGDYSKYMEIYGFAGILVWGLLALVSMQYGVGVAFLWAAINSYGIWKRKAWAWKYGKILQWIIFAIGGVAFFAADPDNMFEGDINITQYTEWIALVVAVPSTAGSLVGLGMLYNKKAAVYFGE